jgi:hypothetical protein
MSSVHPLPSPPSNPLTLIPTPSVGLTRTLNTVGELRARLRDLPDSVPLVFSNNRWGGVGTLLGLAEAQPGVRAVCFRFYDTNKEPCPWCSGDG